MVIERELSRRFVMRLRNFHYIRHCYELLSSEDRGLFSSAMEKFSSDLQLAGIHCPDTESTGLFVAFERDGKGPVVILGMMKMRMLSNLPSVETVVLAPEIIINGGFALPKLILNGMISCIYDYMQDVRRGKLKILLVRAIQPQALAIATWIHDDPNMVKLNISPYVCYVPGRTSTRIAFHRDRKPCWSLFPGHIPSDPIPPWQKKRRESLEW